MDIRPGWGIGAFRFGLTEGDLIAALGPPDKRYTTDSGIRRLQYFGPRVEFAIEPENGDRFGWAGVHNSDSKMSGRRVVGEPVAEVVPALVRELGEQPELEDYGSSESYFFRGRWVEVRVEFGRVVSVNLGVLYGADDEPLWPSAEPFAAPDPAM